MVRSDPRAAAPHRSHRRRACAAQPGARPDHRRVGSIDRARARRVRPRLLDPRLGRLPQRALRRLRTVPAACCTSTSSGGPSERSSSTGRTTRHRRPTTCPWRRSRATTAMTGKGLEVAFDARGALEGARGSAHLGWNGSAPWWDQRRDNWAPYDGIAYRAAGSHATGLAPRRPRSCRRRLERRPRRRRGALVRAARRRSGRARRAAVRLRRRRSLGEAGLDRSRRRAHRWTRIVSRRGGAAARAWALGLDAAGVGSPCRAARGSPGEPSRNARDPNLVEPWCPPEPSQRCAASSE